jgi:RNA polymerase sigma-70 factor (ECF subfamily)
VTVHPWTLDVAPVGNRPLTGEQFQSVLNAARTGAEWAWARIYDSLAPTLAGYLRAQGAPDPDGVCGEVFVQLVRDIHRFEGNEAGFRSWVFVMVHHRLIDDARRRQRRPEAASTPESMAAIEDPENVEETVVKAATERELRGLLDELTEPQRDVLLLRVFGGMTLEEVADLMHRRVGAVKALQRRGLEALRAKLAARGLYPSGPQER